MADSSSSLPESHPMNGGDGDFSYTKNSSLQRRGLTAAKDIIGEAISQKLDTPTTTTFNIVDMGCSVGPNTFFAVHNIIQAVRSKFHATTTYNNNNDQSLLEFQVFFNDHTANDFNTLFTSLPSERQYYTAAVPGSFHSRLFPKSSLHFVHSSYALQWLSKVPDSVLNRDSPAWNKGRVHYTGAADQVGEAYAAQFAKDMGAFLSARAEEMARGGLLAVVMPGARDGDRHSQFKSGFIFHLLGSCLMDMVMEGKVMEEKVDTFNYPLYGPCRKDITEVVEANGCFSIERLDVTETGISASPETATMHLRAGSDNISKHFGAEIIDELFDRYLKKAQENAEWLDSESKEGVQLIVILKRK